MILFRLGIFLLNLRRRGGVVNTSIAIATAKALVDKSKNRSSFAIPTSSWAKSLFNRMGFKRRTATTGKLVIPEGARKEAEFIYLHEIVSIVEKHSNPPSVVVNLDQTPSKYVQASRHTMAKKGVATVEIVGSGDKTFNYSNYLSYLWMAPSYPCN